MLRSGSPSGVQPSSQSGRMRGIVCRELCREWEGGRDIGGQSNDWLPVNAKRREKGPSAERHAHISVRPSQTAQWEFSRSSNLGTGLYILVSVSLLSPPEFCHFSIHPHTPSTISERIATAKVKIPRTMLPTCVCVHLWGTLRMTALSIFQLGMIILLFLGTISLSSHRKLSTLYFNTYSE